MPDKIGRYEIKREVGRGGMSIVYLAYDPRFRREVALKVLPRQFTHDPKFLGRFEKEAQTIAALEHYAIVPVYDSAEEDDAPYLAMRYMSGGSLRERMRGKPLSLNETSRIFTRLAPALDKAHREGIIHRDLKPANVLFDEENQPYLADFGIARIAEETHTMTVVGTPSYMSPEQVRGQQELDGRSDIYTLGVMLYEMLSGRRPYEAKTPSGKMMMHMLDPVPDLLSTNAQLPPQAQLVIDKAMAKDREERYGTAVALAQAVQYLLQISAAINESEIPPLLPSVPENEALTGDLEPAADALAAASAEMLPDIPPDLLAGETKRAADLLEAQSPANASHSSNDDRTMFGELLPAWGWWAGAITIVLLLLFGIRTIYQGIVGPAPPPTAVIADVPTATATPTLTPTTTATNTPQPTETPSAVPSLTPTPIPTPTLDPYVPPPNPALGTLWQRPPDQMQMVYVPQGVFSMGSEEGDDEKPVHRVALDGFWIDKSEVTNAQYTRCVTAGECAASIAADDPNLGLAEYPVVFVSWEDANLYCAWAGAQLPAEAQWEYAARGPEGSRYPWGEEDPSCELTRYSACLGWSVPVGTFPGGVSWAGALDMAGNVSEWVNDWYASDYYANSLTFDPLGPEKGVEKVSRGGGWTDGEHYLRSSSRAKFGPSVQFSGQGFRCALPGS